VFDPLLFHFVRTSGLYIRLPVYMSCRGPRAHPCTHWQVPLLALWHCVRVIAMPPRVVVKHQEKLATNSWTRSGVTTVLYSNNNSQHRTSTNGSAAWNERLTRPVPGLESQAYDIHRFLMDIFPHDRDSGPEWTSAPSSLSSNLACTSTIQSMSHITGLDGGIA
jgi:hypothetical protein